ncbi:uncharacterized protein MELLADRAFT_103604 [Melampsora larici-populina 98AG31]|uniref:Uncharacterized protein n=1 Tax=Melampsora larici-populina (strain 98AG31 / pathotype 3-4-7) TaxID=747676 RepID=F4RBW1_MELLP|nr:uncharacterized protein MELLADRAFT_103604 [Melampsora larici-populina 98AG31]EGG10176.1 hypothetical protein MELLADRAFT_103604 [Melampsora larici-populina 98AG31]
MTELEQFLETGTDLTQRATPDSFRMRLMLMTHEFLLLLLKAKLTFDPDEEDLNGILVEGYQWVINIWRTIPMKTFTLNNVLKRTTHTGASTEIPSIEDTLISRIAICNFFNRSQHQFLAYIILKWMQQFRPRWFKTAEKTIKCLPKELPAYKPKYPLAQKLLSHLNRTVLGMKIDA